MLGPNSSPPAAASISGGGDSTPVILSLDVMGPIEHTEVSALNRCSKNREGKPE